FAYVVKHGLELGRLLTCQLDVTELALTEQGNFTRLAFVGHGDDFVARRRHFGQALYLNGNGRTCTVDRFAVFVEHGADTTETGTRQYGITTAEGATLDQNGRNRAASLVKTGFNHNTLGGRFDRRGQ